MAIKLEPCPFCGCNNITILSKKTNIWRNGFGDCVEYRVYSARCNRCNARGTTAGGQCAPSERTVKIHGTETLVHSYKYYHDKAAEAWNTRQTMQDSLDAMCSLIKKVVRTESDDGDWYAALLQDGSRVHFHEMNDILRLFIFNSTHAVRSYVDYTGQTVYERR